MTDYSAAEREAAAKQVERAINLYANSDDDYAGDVQRRH